jgi:SAM-dependent methyltransferase
VPSASPRLAWTAGIVAPTPAERILEVGCGHGVLVSLLAERLRGGVVVGVDRSAAMVAAARRRNLAAVEAGRVRLQAASLVDAALDGPFDVVVSFNVRAFWTPPAPVWDVVDRVLAPKGRVYVAFSLMGADAERPVTDAVATPAAVRGMSLTAVHRGPTAPSESVALELRRSSSAAVHPNG